MTTLHLRKSIGRSPLRLGFLLIGLALALAWFALSPPAQAVSPPPDGGYFGFNTAEGDFALNSLTTGSNNTATGSSALRFNTTGFSNTATGSAALFSNTTGSGNTAANYLSLKANTTGSNNTAIGSFTLQNNTTADLNTAYGWSALRRNTTGRSNIALGATAGLNLTTGSNNIEIGNAGVAGESNTIRIGDSSDEGQTDAFIAGISGVTVAGGVGVIIDSSGHLGRVVSSERFKDEIKPMDKASEAILALKPVTFRYKHDLDPEGIPQFGLVAEQVEKVNPALVARDAQGKVYTVRYEAVNAMLLNEFLKEHGKVEEQGRKLPEQEVTIAEQRKSFQASITKLETTVAHQRKEMEALTARLKEQAAQIQKVSGQLEVSKAAPQMVVNNQ